jgi:RHS repeat-associated protein
MAVITDEPTDAETPAVESLADYYPFGMTMPGRSYNAHTSRHGFTGHEKESDLAEGIYTTEYRLYDARVGRWLSIDPLFEKNIDASPYSYCHGNPVKLIDPDGRDEEQRTTAINRAKEYVEKNPKNKTGDTSYMNGAKGGPGEKVDCSGLVSNCVVAGGEKDPNHGNALKGTVNMWNNTAPVDKSKIVVGNMIFFGKKGKEENINHVGLVSNITYDEKGNIKDLSFIASNSSTGPDDVTLYKDGKSMNSYWVPRIVGYRKWDTKPDYQINHETNINQYSSETINKSSNEREHTRYLNLKKDLGTLIRYMGLRRR